MFAIVDALYIFYDRSVSTVFLIVFLVLVVVIVGVCLYV